MTRRALRVLATILAGLVLALTVATGVGPPGASASAAPPTTTTTTTAVAPACDPACVARIHRTYAYAAAVERARVHQVYAFAAAVERARVARIYAFAHAVEQARQAAAYPRGQCGGRLPSCRVLNRESGGDLRVWNGRCYAPYGWRGAVAPNCPRARSSASGKWQMVRGTWSYCRTGYVNAADAPERVQDDCAAIIKRVQPSAWD